MATIKILIIDDEKDNTQQLMDILNEKKVGDCFIQADEENDFSKGVARLKKYSYDIVILDLYQGTPSQDDNRGKKVLKRIKETVPITIIIHTALTKDTADFKSDMIRIVEKESDGSTIIDEVKSLIKTKLPLVKRNIIKQVRKDITKYYWEFENKRPKFKDTDGGSSLFEYLIMRRISLSLGREAAQNVLNYTTENNKVHPLSMYIVPAMNKKGIEMGDIFIKKVNSSYWIVLTPACDLVVRSSQTKNEDSYILLAGAQSISEHPKIKDKKVGSKERDKEIKKFIKSSRLRYYFLPRIEINSMPDLVVDFQKTVSVNREDFKLGEYQKVARLDDPYSQDIQAQFTNYFNRPGAPDIDIDYVINYLNKPNENAKE